MLASPMRLSIHRSIPTAALVAALLLSVSVAVAEPQSQWGQWRGPLATGEAPRANPPLNWSESSNVKWKVSLPGSGTSSPIVWGNQVFIQTAIAVGGTVQADPPAAGGTPVLGAIPPGGRRGGGGLQQGQPYQFVLMCLDRQSGNVLWQRVAQQTVPHEGHHQEHGYSSYSAVTDGEHVFAYFGSRGLHCYDMQGNPVWQKDLGRMQTRNGFGEGSSPALHGDTIVINWDHQGDDFIVAFDKRTGRELWRTPRNENTSWSTPIVVEHDGQKQVVTTASNRVRSYDLATGKLIWECAGLGDNVIPSPVAGHGMVFATSGYRTFSLMAIRLGRGGDLSGTDAIAWQVRQNTPYVPSPLLYDGRIYVFASNNAVLSCFNAPSGRALFQAQRVEGLSGVYASPVGAAGRVYIVGRNGATVVIRASDQYQVLATNVLREPIDASPAVVDGEIFLRGRQSLYCIAAP